MLLLLFFLAFGAGVLSGVVGTGSSLIMLPVLTRGLAIGIALLVGSMIAKRLVQKLQTHTFELLIDAVLVAGAAGMILALK
ncbi:MULTISPECIES: hypothetical protein [Pectobacterium]|uniref:hypothetical protein n=1 Tax=Pectobacterium TaxID=122277 RepID=UPI000657AEB9|nr:MULTISPECIES: hypothetical protein [Pectobacterium]KLV49924.1 hypothetical protein SK32_00602 [Citrobacter sp. MGH100]GKV95077.1 hypothetical protein PEC301645_25240 [Pectobacterium carotovorum subsp. carotovorum]